MLRRAQPVFEPLMTASNAPVSPSASRPGAVRTRFAPSPTGLLHIGGARTALFAWAFARHFGGSFVLRVEDTDVARSTPEAVQAILDGMRWLGLEADEGPFYQMQRMDRYRAVIAEMLAAGTAYPCYCTPEELEALREAQRARGEKPRYDGRWRPERAKAAGLVPPEGVKPVIRFRNPDDGVVAWDDLVKGPIAIGNAELDDLIIARSDGTPTYNFCVVVDDHDMAISHVIRGDDHVNNTPRQINILRALGATVPIYGHLPMIHGPDGQKLSKRHGAVSVLEYDRAGYLPDALNNYLARLGWSHGDDEIFSREQFVAWFDGGHLSESPSQLDYEKLRWLNQQYLKQLDEASLARAVAPRLAARLDGVTAVAPTSPPTTPTTGEALAARISLLKDRAATLEDLADELAMFDRQPDPANPKLVERLADDKVRSGLAAFAARLASLPDADWTVAGLAAALKTTLTEAGLKMPQLAIPVRLAVFGTEKTPSIDAMLALTPRDTVLARLASAQQGAQA